MLLQWLQGQVWCVGIYTKLRLVHGPLDVHHSCTSLLSFTFKNNFLNFVNNLEKNIFWNVAKTIAQWEISLINLEPRFPEMYSTAYNLEFKGDPNWGTITIHWIRACSAVALNGVEDHEWSKVNGGGNLTPSCYNNYWYLVTWAQLAYKQVHVEVVCSFSKSMFVACC